MYTDLINHIYTSVLEGRIAGFFNYQTYTLEYTPTNKQRILFMNPSYNTDTVGLEATYNTLNDTEADYVVLLVKENAGEGVRKASIFQKKILENHTLIASVKMPANLFCGVVSVQTALFIFKTGEPHDKNNAVHFFDLSIDGFNRQRSKRNFIIKDVKDGKGHYAELVKRLFNLKVDTQYLTEDAGTYIKDTITLDGEDWVYKSHKKIDTTVTEEDLKKTIRSYLTWKADKELRNKNNKQERYFKDVFIGELFTFESSPKDIKLQDYTVHKEYIDGYHPYISATLKNNGRAGYIKENPQYLMDKNTITIGTSTGTSFYQEEPYFLTKSNWCLKLKNHDMTLGIGLYLLQGIRHAMSQFTWGARCNQEVLKKLKLRIPYVDGQIDYEYMEMLSKKIMDNVEGDAGTYTDRVIKMYYKAAGIKQ